MQTLSSIIARGRHFLPSCIFIFWCFVVLDLPSIFLLGFTPIHYFTFYSVFAITILIPMVIHMDPPISTDALTLTMPINRKKLFLWKIILILGLCGLIPCCMGVLKLYLITDSLPILLRGATCLVVLQLALLMPSIFIASVTRKYVDYAVVMITFIIVIFTSNEFLKPLTIWPRRAFYLAPSFETAQSLEHTISISFLITLAVIGVMSFVASYRAHMRAKPRELASLVITALVVVAAVQALAIYDLRKAFFSTAEPKLQEIQIADSNVVLKPANSSLAGAPFIADFELSPVSSTQQFPHILRFKELNLIDDDYAERVIPVKNRGSIPCINTNYLEQFLHEKVNNKIKLEPKSCRLGESYRIPQDVKLKRDKIKTVKGSVYGMNLVLSFDYINDPQVGQNATEFSPVKSKRSNYYDLPYPRFQYSSYSYSYRPVNEAFLFSPLVRNPLASRTQDTPLSVHWFSTPLTYILFDEETGQSALFHTWKDAGKQEDSFLISLSTPSFFPEGEIPKPLAEKGKLVRISSRLVDSFVAPILLTDVRIHRKEYTPLIDE